jgi:hypothetical protein
MEIDPNAAEQSPPDPGCPIFMDASEMERCELPLHLSPDGADSEPVCLMHSKDPAKQQGELLRQFDAKVK